MAAVEDAERKLRAVKAGTAQAPGSPHVRRRATELLCMLVGVGVWVGVPWFAGASGRAEGWRRAEGDGGRRQDEADPEAAKEQQTCVVCVRACVCLAADMHSGRAARDRWRQSEERERKSGGGEIRSLRTRDAAEPRRLRETRGQRPKQTPTLAATS